MLYRLGLASRGSITRVFVVQCWLWSGDGDGNNGGGLAVRSISSWARAQIGFASFDLDLFVWIMFMVMLGSTIVWFRIWDPGDLTWILSVDAFWNWTLVT